jgi:purine-nucleoside phosphorylase
MVVIYTALLCEAQSIIEKYKLSKVNNNPKIYKNDVLLVLIGGIGELNTQSSLGYLFENYKVKKAFNIGIAGCSDKEVHIGELFCTNKILENINSMELTTVKTPQILDEGKKSLYDMEGQYFLEIAQKYLKDEDIFILKVVSDHLDDTILPKDKVKELIQNSLKSWEKWI